MVLQLIHNLIRVHVLAAPGCMATTPLCCFWPGVQ